MCGAEPDPVSVKTYARAIAAYQATLTTPAPFDRFLAGDDAALDARQRAGLQLFMASGCAACHDGPLLGGTKLHRFGVVKDYAAVTGSGAAIRIEFDDPADWQWAPDMWRSLAPG